MAAMPLELQRGEEDFDLALITTLQTSLLPYLGQSSVPDDAIRQLARSLQHASILYRPADEEASEVALRSPAMTLVGSGDSDALAGGSKMQAKGDGSLSSEGKSAIEGSTVPDVDLPGERFSYWSCDLLFSMCASKPTERGEQRRTRTSKPRRRKAIREERKADGCVDASEPTLDELIDGDVSMDERRRIATITLPCLIERCGSALESYLADSAIRGRLPFGRWAQLHRGCCCLRPVNDADVRHTVSAEPERRSSSTFWTSSASSSSTRACLQTHSRDRQPATQ